MVQDAEAHAAEDRARREQIEKNNQLDTLIYQAEKTLARERRQDRRGRAQAASRRCSPRRKEDLESDDVARLDAARQRVEKASMHKAAERSTRRSRRRRGRRRGGRTGGSPGGAGARRRRRRDRRRVHGGEGQLARAPWSDRAQTRRPSCSASSPTGLRGRSLAARRPTSSRPRRRSSCASSSPAFAARTCTVTVDGDVLRIRGAARRASTDDVAAPAPDGDRERSLRARHPHRDPLRARARDARARGRLPDACVLPKRRRRRGAASSVERTLNADRSRSGRGAAT